jgi:hypothetical protein
VKGPGYPEEILAVLRGLPLWGANRAVDMVMFQFGSRHRRERRRRPGEQGGPRIVRDITLDPDGKLSIEFDRDTTLVVTPIVDGLEEDEDWRFFSPGEDKPQVVHRLTGPSLE